MINCLLYGFCLQRERVATEDTKALEESLHQKLTQVTDLEGQLSFAQSKLKNTMDQLAEREKQLQQVSIVLPRRMFDQIKSITDRGLKT